VPVERQQEEGNEERGEHLRQETASVLFLSLCSVCGVEKKKKK
jgi:hypothetical protein